MYLRGRIAQSLACRKQGQYVRSQLGYIFFVEFDHEIISKAILDIVGQLSVTGEYMYTPTVGVRRGCLLSPTLFNIFLERIMCEALDDHEGSVSIGGRLITNFRFADDIVVNVEEEEEAGVLIDRLGRTTTRYKMEIGPDKTKVMTNNPNGFQREIKIKGQRLEEVENFKYLGAIISNEGSKPEILSRIAQTTAALSRLKIIWRD